MLTHGMGGENVKSVTASQEIKLHFHMKQAIDLRTSLPLRASVVRTESPTALI